MKFIITLILALWTTISLACTCTMTPIENHIQETDIIVTVQVVELLDTKEEREEYYFSKPDQGYRVKVKVLKLFKGELQTEQIIELDSEFSNCDIYYKDKNNYLLFLKKEGDKYYMKHCSYSEHIDNAEKNITAIEKELKE